MLGDEDADSASDDGELACLEMSPVVEFSPALEISTGVTPPEAADISCGVTSKEKKLSSIWEFIVIAPKGREMSKLELLNPKLYGFELDINESSQEYNLFELISISNSKCAKSTVPSAVL